MISHQNTALFQQHSKTMAAERHPQSTLSHVDITWDEDEAFQGEVTCSRKFQQQQRRSGTGSCVKNRFRAR